MKLKHFKYTFVILFAIGLVLLSAPVLSAAIIIDHTCTDITKIPDSWITKVKNTLRVHYAHTSHGSQITTGLERLADSNSKYSYSYDYCSVPTTSGALKLMDGQYITDYCESYITPELYWQGTTALDITRYNLNNYSFEISEWAWCSQLDYYNYDEAKDYLDAMAQLESEYPGVTFIYMTGNAQGAEQNRESRNNQIRNYCRTNNKVLFDFGDLDCWYNGEQYKVGSLPMEHPHYNGDEAGHTTYESCENKAKAYWWMLARIAGWSGPVTTNPVINLNKTQLTFNYETGGSQPASQTFTISNSGTGTLNWSVADNAGWLACSPTSGTNTGVITVSVNTGGLAAGTYTGVITISSTNASNSPQTVNVTFTVTNPPVNPPEISINPAELYFSAVISGPVTGPQQVRIENTGGDTLNWSAASDSAWLSCTPTSGTGDSIISVSVDPSGLSVGSFTGTITISDPAASNSPQTVTVYLTVIDASEDQAPFGSFDSPTEGSTVMSSIAVTGWALDDIGVEYVKIYNGDTYIGDAVLVEGARPDVAAAYPQYPNNSRAGWGYMLLTYFLPNGGNGTYTLYAKAGDSAGHETTLGSKTITCDNANAVKPFGAIDTPSQGGTVSGKFSMNWGWVLTPQPNSIPTNGSTINVYVDGVNLGHPTYNIYRADIATLFPGYANSNNAVGYFNLDTTGYDNGVHTIAWIAADSGGNSDGIGSRFFMINNSSSDMDKSGGRVQGPGIRENRRGSAAFSPCSPIFAPCSPNSEHPGAVRVLKGYKDDASQQSVYPGESGIIDVVIRESERVVIDFGNVPMAPLKTLPIGSTLDRERGIFYWLPGPGFIGKYELTFVDRRTNGLRKVNITIQAK
ncbi:MAG: hypothetical protein QG657_461 [Acidobacteriota bacterium]|nr:hypothetical protein [Acidobacteriota bacterium]